MKLTLIAAVAKNGAIGLNNGLLWRDPLDQQHFRATTLGHPVVMGRKTWDSLPQRFRPLPGRRNVVVTRNPALQFDGAESVPSLQAALQLLSAEPHVYVMGGGELYAQALPLANEMVLTEIDAELVGDVHFPRWDAGLWSAATRLAHTAQDGTRFSFVKYERRRG